MSCACSTFTKFKTVKFNEQYFLVWSLKIWIWNNGALLRPTIIWSIKWGTLKKFIHEFDCKKGIPAVGLKHPFTMLKIRIQQVVQGADVYSLYFFKDLTKFELAFNSFFIHFSLLLCCFPFFSGIKMWIVNTEGSRVPIN